MRFFAGLGLGLVVGAAAMWLGLRRPWHHGSAVAVAAADAGAVSKDPAKPGKHHHRGHGGGGGGSGGSDDGDVVDEAPAPVLSPADRAMSWRGPAIALPARTVDLGNGDDARPLEASEINDVLARSSGPILACVESGRAGATLQATVRLQLLVSGQGRVDKVRISAPNWLHAHGFDECASRAARGLGFPATGAPTIVDAPFDLY